MISLKNNFIFKLLIIICLITLIISCKLFFRERIILNLNAENKEYIISILEEYTDKVENVSKVAYGRVWSHGYIYVYHPFNKTEELLISEGDFSKGDLQEYIQINGYKEKDVGKLLSLISIIIIIICSIKLKRKKFETF